MKTGSFLFLTLSLTAALVCCSSKKDSAKEQATATEQKVTTEDPQKPATTNVPTEEMSGYFVKSTYKPNADINFIVLKNKAQFDELLGIARTMKNSISTPDFDNTIIAAIVLKTTKNETKIKVKDAKLEGNTLNVYADIETGKELSYSSTPLYLYHMPKNQAKQINLFVNGENKASVELN